MTGIFGTLLALIASALCYLASPRQHCLRKPMPIGASLSAATVCMVAGGSLWCSQAGVAAGVCAAVGALAAGLALMPFIGAYWRHGVRSGRQGVRSGAAPSQTP